MDFGVSESSVSSLLMEDEDLAFSSSAVNDSLNLSGWNESLETGVGGVLNGTAAPQSRDEDLAKIEIGILALIFIMTVLGNFIVLLGIYFRRQKMSRMYYFILHLSIADLITAFFNVLTQLIWELTWHFQGDNFLCKFIKYAQILGPYSSSYVLVMTAFDRYQAICYPLNSYTWTARRSKLMLGFAWTLSIILCTPQLFIFSYMEVTPGVFDCWATFIPNWGAKAYVTWYAVTVFIIPLVILTFAYSCICRAIWINFSMKNSIRRHQQSRSSRISRDSETENECCHSTILIEQNDVSGAGAGTDHGTNANNSGPGSILVHRGKLDNRNSSKGSNSNSSTRRHLEVSWRKNSGQRASQAVSTTSFSTEQKNENYLKSRGRAKSGRSSNPNETDEDENETEITPPQILPNGAKYPKPKVNSNSDSSPIPIDQEEDEEILRPKEPQRKSSEGSCKFNQNDSNSKVNNNKKRKSGNKKQTFVWSLSKMGIKPKQKPQQDDKTAEGNSLLRTGQGHCQSIELKPKTNSTFNLNSRQLLSPPHNNTNPHSHENPRGGICEESFRKNTVTSSSFRAHPPQHMSVNMQPRSSSVKGISRAKIKTVKLTVTVICCYIFCSSPFIAAQLWANYDPDASKSPFWTGATFTILTLLASLNSCVNPYIFLFFNPNLLQDFLKGFGCSNLIPEKTLGRSSPNSATQRTNASPSAGGINSRGVSRRDTISTCISSSRTDMHKLRSLNSPPNPSPNSGPLSVALTLSKGLKISGETTTDTEALSIVKINEIQFPNQNNGKSNLSSNSIPFQNQTA